MGVIGIVRRKMDNARFSAMLALFSKRACSVECQRVARLVGTVDTHPEEFYANNDTWKFIYKEYFRDSMSETEKGMVFDKIKKIRRQEFTGAVLEALLVPDEKKNPKKEKQ
jgi:hypothetical protein